MSLGYEFPSIHHIDNVTWALDDNFRVVEKDGLTFINYNMMGNDVFPDVIPSNNALGKRMALRAAIRRECRGIVFDTASGFIVSRPFHKFFNVGEREDMLTVDVSTDHVVLEKLDGSMIRPLPTAGGMRWGTKMGITDVALLAEEFCADKPKYAKFASIMMGLGFTPIFEFGSRRSRVVVDFPEEVMVLLDIRNNITGAYDSRTTVAEVAAAWDIPVVDYVDFRGKSHGVVQPVVIKDLSSFLEWVRQESAGEGKVIAWADGHKAKKKNDKYVIIHRAKDMIRSERRVLELILSEGVDDLLPILVGTSDYVRVLNYIDRFSSEVSARTAELASVYEHCRSVFTTKKDFATSEVAKTLQYPAWMRPAIFSLWDGKLETARDAVIKAIKNGMSSESRFSEMKQELSLNTGWFDNAVESQDAA